MRSTFETLLANIMFNLAILFLAVTALLVQYLQTDFSIKIQPYLTEMFYFLLMLWFIFCIERILFIIFCAHNRRNQIWFSLLILLFPPLRLAIRRCSPISEIWIYSQWQPVEPNLFEILESWFLYLSLTISLVMLPFWIIEIFYSELLYQNLLLHHIVNFGNALIWGIFVAEFILEFSITKKRGEYVIKHWLELFIIILPMVMLSRFVRLSYIADMVGLGRLAESQIFKIAKLQQMLTLYRARVIFNRVLRILAIIDLFQRWQQRHNPQKYLLHLQEQLTYHQEQLIEIQQKIAETHRLIAEKQKNSDTLSK